MLRWGVVPRGQPKPRHLLTSSATFFFLSFFLSVVIPILSKERKIEMSDDVCIVAMKYKKGYIEGYPIENFL